MTPRQIALAVLIVIAGIATFAIVYLRPTPAVPTPVPDSAIPLPYSYLIDVNGWYEITPNERAVASPFDLSIDGLKKLPDQVGDWKGSTYELGSAVNEWFENPDLALSNIYTDTQGHQVWFSTFGSRGRKSYFLFEHTPITSYPAAGWTLVENGVTQVPIDTRSIYVQKATLTKGNERRIVFYWYLWNDFQRDPEKGVLTIRLHIPVIKTDQDAIQAGNNFLHALFPEVITWRRF